MTSPLGPEDRAALHKLVSDLRDIDPRGRASMPVSVARMRPPKVLPMAP
jgi:hypothetical protein